ncbi:tripartite tricarboxylate transporter permease [Ruegeria arenilitoris]|uniref:tripartite tricarboxylate transporter permease n=1 Tax=Ruegeria arenilitoris TaxID=1173585 RepID=UPI00147BAA4A|nr:tripartite tricarboxylate transporter permease [Ruegeria arenilitoris]
MELLHGFYTIFTTPETLMFVVLGAVLGVIVGAVPGLTASAAIAMLVPITYYIDPLSALAFLYVIGKAGRFGGSISAILFNTPGTTAAAATVIDGHALTKKGKAGKALKTATVASVIGDFIGELILIFGALTIAQLTRELGPPDYFAIYVCAFLIIGSVISDSVLKGIASTLFGATLAMIGLDPITSEPRYDFGMVELYNGLSLVPLLIGLFVISEVFSQVFPARKGQEHHDEIQAKNPDDDRLSWEEIKRCLPFIGRGSAIGSMVGLIPGVGSAVACFVAYGSSKAKAKNKDEWGKGAIEGVAAPEAANNAVSGPSMIPLLALGVPGSTIAAMLMGVFLIHGIQVGPKIFETSGDVVYGLFAAGLTGILLYGLIGWFGGPLIGRVIDKIPQRLIYPTILAVALISAYTARSSMFDVVIACIFGLIGYFMRTLNFSPAATIIAFVLAPGAEQALRQSVLLTDDGFGIFLTRPVALVFFAIPLVAIGIRIVARFRASKQTAELSA